jgi:hypothetical protein
VFTPSLARTRWRAAQQSKKGVLDFLDQASGVPPKTWRPTSGILIPFILHSFFLLFIDWFREGKRKKKAPTGSLVEGHPSIATGPRAVPGCRYTDAPEKLVCSVLWLTIRTCFCYA